jgi:hypothetical protein
MKAFRELSIKGSSDELASFIDGIAFRLEDGWEGVENINPPNSLKPFYFTCPEAPGRTECEIWIAHRSPNELYVSNIVPKSYQGQFSYDDYNAILLEFYNRFAFPVATERHLRVELSSGDVDLETWLSPTAAKALRLFSQKANKSTGASHPEDQKRWYAFVILADKENAHLDASTLARWLREEAGWAESIASELAGEYEQARSLLAYEHAG